MDNKQLSAMKLQEVMKRGPKVNKGMLRAKTWIAKLRIKHEENKKNAS